MPDVENTGPSVFSATDGAFHNKPADVPTYHVDGIKGVVVQPNVTKVSFYEMTADPGVDDALGRFVCTFSFPNDSLRGVVELLSRVLADTPSAYPQQAETASNGNQ